MQFTLAELWAHMGVPARLVVLTMLGMSAASMMVVVERAWVLLRGNRASVAFIQHLAAWLEAGDLDGAVAECAGDSTGHGPLGRVVGAALWAYRESPKRHYQRTLERVARALERQGQREIHAMKRGIGILSTVASTAPFVGLLGTVMGIVNAFSQMAASGSGGLATVSAGISEALVTTALGLLVAIPAVAAYNGLAAWVDARGVDISEAGNELMDMMARELHSRETGEASVTFRQRPLVSATPEA